MSKMTLERIVSEFRQGILDADSSESKCYMVCAPLAGYLRCVGFEVKLVKGRIDGEDFEAGHFWLELPDGRIIDPTADQFSSESRPMPAVYIGPQPKWYQVLNKYAA
jgi:hypothetical protein